jgi:uncharacterized membrane protein YkvA (DUF1232 family)
MKAPSQQRSAGEREPLATRACTYDNWERLGCQPAVIQNLRCRVQSVLTAAKAWAKTIKRDVIALWIAARDRRTPWYAKGTAGLVAAYALSPIDLIPDFIPVIGYLDDLLIVPIGIRIVVAIIPLALMAEFRAEAAKRITRPISYAGATAIGAIWIVAIVLTIWFFWPRRPS